MTITTIVISKQELSARKMLTMTPLRLSVQVIGVLRIKRLSPSLLTEAGIEDRSNASLCLDPYRSAESVGRYRLSSVWSIPEDSLNAIV